MGIFTSYFFGIFKLSQNSSMVTLCAFGQISPLIFSGTNERRNDMADFGKVYFGCSPSSSGPTSFSLRATAHVT